jgi:hypothetical protein
MNAVVASPSARKTTWHDHAVPGPTVRATHYDEGAKLGNGGGRGVHMPVARCRPTPAAGDRRRKSADECLRHDLRFLCGRHLRRNGSGGWCALMKPSWDPLAPRDSRRTTRRQVLISDIVERASHAHNDQLRDASLDRLDCSKRQQERPSIL